MTRKELVKLLMSKSPQDADKMHLALRAIVELHKPMEGWDKLEVCNECSDDQYVWLPCPTIQAIEKVLE
jgi:hypothetical protein